MRRPSFAKQSRRGNEAWEMRTLNVGLTPAANGAPVKNESLSKAEMLGTFRTPSEETNDASTEPGTAGGHCGKW